MEENSKNVSHAITKITAEKPINFDKVADIYDYYVNVLFDVPFFMNETKHTNTPVLELMCGTGRVSIPLLEAGRELVCIDYSQGMLDKFIEKTTDKSYKLTILNANVSELSLNRKFDTIIIPFHAFQEIIVKEMQIAALKAIYNHLSDSGIFICTLKNPKMQLPSFDGSTRIMGKYKMDDNKDLIMSHCNIYQDGIVTGYQFYEIFDQENRLTEKRYLEINFKPIEFDEFQNMLNEVGFIIDKVYGSYDYADFVPEKSSFMIFRLTK
jgi:ubiquinone/menaquinone biosynthesis C-methylase UbiE